MLNRRFSTLSSSKPRRSGMLLAVLVRILCLVLIAFSYEVRHVWYLSEGQYLIIRLVLWVGIVAVALTMWLTKNHWVVIIVVVVVLNGPSILGIEDAVSIDLPFLAISAVTGAIVAIANRAVSAKSE